MTVDHLDASSHDRRRVDDARQAGQRDARVDESQQPFAGAAGKQADGRERPAEVAEQVELAVRQVGDAVAVEIEPGPRRPSRCRGRRRPSGSTGCRRWSPRDGCCR